MKLISRLAILLVTFAAYGQNSGMGADYYGIRLDEAGNFELNLQTFIFDRIENGADFTLLADDPDDNMRVRARTVRFFYDDENANTPSRITMDGNAVIEHPQAEVRSEFAEVNFSTGDAVFTGNPQVFNERTPDGLFAEEIRLNLESGELTIVGGRAELLYIETPAEQEAKNRLSMKETGISDWAGFLTSFKRQLASESAAPAKRIISLLGDEAEAMMRHGKVDRLLEEKAAIIDSLNRLLPSPELYDGAAWNGFTIPAAAQTLLDRGSAKLTDEEQRWLNWSLIHAAFSEYVASPPPISQ